MIPHCRRGEQDAARGWLSNFAACSANQSAKTELRRVPIYEVNSRPERGHFGASTYSFALFHFTPESVAGTLCDATGNRVHRFDKKPSRR